eukprot:235224-Amphidinium_carterae.1
MGKPDREPRMNKHASYDLGNVSKSISDLCPVGNSNCVLRSGSVQWIRLATSFRLCLVLRPSHGTHSCRGPAGMSECKEVANNRSSKSQSPACLK